MIAHLNNGGPLLNPATATLMHAPANHFYSALPPMALGFYHEDRNGLNIVGHGGDTIFFHSDLHLFLDKKVGLYVSMNSPGKNTAVHPLREQLFEDFTDRYFPAPAQNLPTSNSAKADGAAISGHYVSSRAGGFNWTRMLSLLGETSVAVDKDGYLIASSVTDPSGAPRKWREVGPSWLWQESQRLRQAAGRGRWQWPQARHVLDHALCGDHRIPSRARVHECWMDPAAGRPRAADYRDCGVRLADRGAGPQALQICVGCPWPSVIALPLNPRGRVAVYRAAYRRLAVIMLTPHSAMI